MDVTYAASVTEYLSPEWLRELDRSLRASASVLPLAPIVIEQVVEDVPGRGEVRYRICVGGDGVDVIEGVAPEPPDVRLTTDYRTAVAIAGGRENAQTALAHGRLRLGGDVECLVRRSGALAALDDATVALRAVTTYPSP